MRLTCAVLCENPEETFACPETGGNGNYADPATCRRFYQVKCIICRRKKKNHFYFVLLFYKNSAFIPGHQCVDNHPYLNRCPAGLYFDDVNKLCTFKNEARCGPLPTSKVSRDILLLLFNKYSKQSFNVKCLSAFDQPKRRARRIRSIWLRNATPASARCRIVFAPGTGL